MDDVSSKKPTAEIARERALALQRQQGLISAEFARRAGLHASAITQLEQGTRPTLGKLDALAKGLRVTVAHLVAEEGETIPAATPDEKELLNTYRRLRPDEQVDLLAYARGMARPKRDP
jgi:transcriptional regulator with XRE-family HTH domain